MLHLVLVRHRVKGTYTVHEAHDIDPVPAHVWENHAQGLFDLYVDAVMVVPQDAGENVLTFQARVQDLRPLCRGWTNATVNYDYGYVYRTGRVEEVRISDAWTAEYDEIYMPTTQRNYQKGRYQSGGYDFIMEGTPDFQRVTGKNRFEKAVA